MKKRRLVALATAAVMALSMAACGGGSSTTDTTAAGGDAATETTGAGLTPDASSEGQELAGSIKIGDVAAETGDGGTLVVSSVTAQRTKDPGA